MKRKFTIILLTILLVSMLALLFVACSPKEYDMSTVKFVDTTYTYDGTEKKLEITGTLPSGVNVSYSNNKLTDVGEITVTASFIGDSKHNPIPSMTAKLKIVPATIKGVALVDKTVTYNGKEQTLELTGTLPQGSSVQYTNNKATDAGIYNVTAVITNNNYEQQTLTATLTILKATYDMSSVKFEDATFVYDGTEKKLEITGMLPTGVTVSYSTNKRTDAGSTIVTASFTSTDKNYNSIESQKATLTIEKATYDMSGVDFSNASYTYDGTEKEIVISGTLPTGVTVSYSKNKLTNAGSITVTASFVGNENYNSIEAKQATLTINKATYDMSGVTFDDVQFSYDGLPHAIAINGNLPDGVTVDYSCNNLTDAGEWTITASFVGNENYNDIADKTAKLIIVKDGKYHDVVFMLSDTESVKRVVRHGEDVSLIPDVPQKIGYTAEWNCALTDIQNDVCVRPQYTIIHYTATFMADNEIIGTTTFTIEDETLPNIPNVPEKEGYFCKWDNYSIQAENIEVHAVYTAKTFTIKWLNYDGTILSIDTVSYGDMPQYENTPQKRQDAEHTYSFVGWAPTPILACADAEYLACFEVDIKAYYTIKYDANGGTGAPSTQTKEIGKGTVLSNIIPTNGTYVFVGWQCVYNETTYKAGAYFSVDANVTLYAVWGHTCETCEGSGQISSKWTCSYCDGTGWRRKCTSCGSYSIVKRVTIYGTSYQCNSCGLTSTTTVTCSWCSGKGSGYNYYTCGTCSGWGSLKNSLGNHTITLNNEGIIDTKEVGLGEHYNLSKPTRLGYSFVGWFDAKSGGKQYTDVDGLSLYPWNEGTNKTLYAHWAINYYSITYECKLDVDLSDLPTYYTIETPCINLPQLARDGYTFTWQLDSKIITQIDTQLAKNIEITANFVAIRYGISYSLDGGKASNPSNYNVETATFTLNNPTKKGYEFLGWTGSNGNTPQADICIELGSFGELNYTANWQIITYSVTYILGGGTNNSGNINSYKITDSDFALLEPARNHYNFVGWENDGNFVTKIMANQADNIILTAVWEPIKYNIEYILDGGETSNPTYHTIESENIVLSCPTKNGYEFLGWTGSNGNELQKEVTILAGNVDVLSYEAHWQLLTYTIEYVLDGGTNAAKNPSSYTTLDTIELKNATKENYTFLGWFRDSEFSESISQLLGLFGDLKLYAKFEPNTYIATFDTNDGTIVYSLNIVYWENSTSNKTIEFGCADSFNPYTLTMPTRADYLFDGWYWDSQCENPIIGPIVVSENTSIYASWISTADIIGYQAGVVSLVRNNVSSGANSSNGTEISNTKYFYIPTLYSGQSVLTYNVTMSSTGEKLQSGETTREFLSTYQYAGCQLVDMTTGVCLHDYKDTINSYAIEITIELTPGHVYKLYSYARGNVSSYTNAKYEYVRVTSKSAISASISNSTFGLNSNISFYDNIIQETFDANVIAPACDAVIKTGYDCVGWFDSDDNELTDIWRYNTNKTFYAKWIKHEYSVSYVLDGGVNDINNIAQYNVELSNFELLTPTKEGYIFAGWYKDAEFKHEITEIKGSDCQNYTLHAKWIKNEYDVELDYDGGQNCPTVNFYSNDELVRTVDLYKDSTLNYFVPTNGAAGTVFAGWFTEPTLTNSFEFAGVINQNINLYAKWVAIDSDSQYSAFDNTVSIEIQGTNYKYIAVLSLTTQSITVTSNSEYDLYGVVCDANKNILAQCDDIDDDHLDFSITITLSMGQLYYIGYRANQASVSGNANITISGNNTPTQFIVGDYTEITTALSILYGQSYILPTPKKEGYTFIGWFDEDGNKYDCTGIWTIASDVELKAKYSHN